MPRSRSLTWVPMGEPIGQLWPASHSFRLLAGWLVASCAAAGQGPAGFVPWTDSGFSRAEHRTLRQDEIYPRGLPDLPHRLDATILYARNTPWSQARALRQLRLAADILSHCGIAFGQVRLARLVLNARHRRLNAATVDPETRVPEAVAELAAMLPAGTAYPVAFLIGRVDGTKSLAVSYRALDADGPSAPYFDSAWISYPAHWLPRHDRRYSALAHEFAHLLCRCGHSFSANRHLLHGSRNFLSAEVLPEHCQLFKSSPLVSLND